MKMILILLASATMAFAISNPFYPATIGCDKIAGISQLPLTNVNVCDKRDPCDIISPGGKCVSTALDRPIAAYLPKLYPMLTCSSKQCSKENPPSGMNGVLQCELIRTYGTPCEYPVKTTAVYSCGICGSSKGSACFCCSG